MMRVVTKVQDRWTLVVRIVKLKLVWPGLALKTTRQPNRSGLIIYQRM